MTNPQGHHCEVCKQKDREIVQLKSELERLQFAVITDPLTELYNKRHFDESLNKELERTRRSGQPTSLILIDVDHFKSINDRFGHVSGDQVLSAVGKLLKGAMRIIDIPCRIGGEEFALILPSTPVAIAVQVAERLRASIAETPIAIATEMEPLTITVSLGVSAFDASLSVSPKQLINQADQQLYAAKNSGRNRVCALLPESKPSAQITLEEKEALFPPDDN